MGTFSFKPLIEFFFFIVRIAGNHQRLTIPLFGRGVAHEHENLKITRKGRGYITFFHLNLTELAASTTSLKPIAKAANPGVSNPTEATGMAMIL